MSKHLRLLRFWLALGFFGCAVLLYACLMPSPPQVVHVPHYDKIVHFLAYVVLGAWFAEILPRRLLLVFTGLLTLGVGIEWAQSLTAYRSAEVMDVVADVAGTVVGIGLARIGAMRWLEYLDQNVLTK